MGKFNWENDYSEGCLFIAGNFLYDEKMETDRIELYPGSRPGLYDVYLRLWNITLVENCDDDGEVTGSSVESEELYADCFEQDLMLEEIESKISVLDRKVKISCRVAWG